MQRRARLFTLLILVSLASPTVAAERLVLGWAERVVIESTGFELGAKLDTGAVTSSLHATDIERFERDGDDWVRFTVHSESGERSEVIERPLVRDVLIKRHSGPSQRRAVVKLKLCVAGEQHETQFSLIDRSNFDYPVLLGRRFLGEFTLVDSRDRYLAERSCVDD